MIKPIFKTILVTLIVAFISCDSDKDVVMDSAVTQNVHVQKSGAKISDELAERLSKFAVTHVVLNNEMRLLLEDEKNAKFDDLQMDELKASKDEEELKKSLANAGIVKYEEIGDIILSIGKNGHDFYSDNKEFYSYQEETQQNLVLSAIDDAIIGYPIIWNPEDPGESPTARTCYQQFIVARDRCNRNVIRDGVIATAAWLGGPLAGGVAYFGVCWIANDCLTDAREDYNDCRK